MKKVEIQPQNHMEIEGLIVTGDWSEQDFLFAK